MTVGVEANILKKLFGRVYFINGTACAGKSTLVRLLAGRHGGVECGENYHDALTGLIDPRRQPNLGYFQTMSGWPEFLSRTPEEYERWIDGASREAAQLELLVLIRLAQEGKPVFADTNIAPDVLREIAPWRNVAILLSPQSMSVERFFDRPDPEKRFLLERLGEMPDPRAAMDNFRACIARVNSPERYAAFRDSGFFTYVRTEHSTVDEALAAVEAHFGLG